MFLPHVPTVFQKGTIVSITLFKWYALKKIRFLTILADHLSTESIRACVQFLCSKNLIFILTNKKIRIFKCDYFNQWEKSDLLIWVLLASWAVTSLHSPLLAGFRGKYFLASGWKSSVLDLDRMVPSTKVTSSWRPHRAEKWCRLKGSWRT